MRALPEEELEVYKETAVFTEASIPVGLLREHTTRPGTWGRIVVLDGRLLYRILEPRVEEHELSPGHDGAVWPGVRHEVAPLGPVRFKVEFLRARGA